MTILSVLACTESYSWRHNRPFWRQFHEASCASDGVFKWIESTNTSDFDFVAAVRDDTSLPRFLLDFSFTTITNDVVTLLRHAFLGSPQSMRVPFLNAMASLAPIGSRRHRPAVIPLALRFARCAFASTDTLPRIVDLVDAVGDCLRQRQRELGNATSKAFYFNVVELDIGGIDLTSRELLSLRRLARCRQLKLVMDRTITPSTNTALAFGALVESWFPRPPKQSTQSLLTDSPTARLSEVSLDSNILSLPHVASLCSAIHDSANQGVRSLSMCGAFQSSDPSAVWAWVAYALLCEDSVSTIERVDLSNNLLRMVDATAVTKVVTTQVSHRLETVCGFTTGMINDVLPRSPAASSTRSRRRRGRQRRSDEARTVVWASIPAGTAVCLPYPSVAESAAFVFTDTAVGRVIRQTPDTIVVVVPAYGVLSVNASEATIRIPGAAELLPRRRSNLHALCLNFMMFPDHEHGDALFASFFSRMSWNALAILELNGNPLGAGTLESLLTACSRLKSLHLEACELRTIEPLLTGYADGRCVIQHLNVAENEIGGHDVAQLCRLMMDRACPASHLQILNFDQNPIGAQGLQALSTVLRERSALTELVLDRSQDPDSHFRRAMYPYQDQPLGVQPLAGDHRREVHLAQVNQLRTEVLDASVIDQICSYAGEYRHRRVIWR